MKLCLLGHDVDSSTLLIYESVWGNLRADEDMCELSSVFSTLVRICRETNF